MARVLNERVSPAKKEREKRTYQRWQKRIGRKRGGRLRCACCGEYGRENGDKSTSFA